MCVCVCVYDVCVVKVVCVALFTVNNSRSFNQVSD